MNQMYGDNNSDDKDKDEKQKEWTDQKKILIIILGMCLAAVIGFIVRMRNVSTHNGYISKTEEAVLEQPEEYEEQAYEDSKAVPDESAPYQEYMHDDATDDEEYIEEYVEDEEYSEDALFSYEEETEFTDEYKNDSVGEFEIDPNTIENYENNLEPREYLYYNSGIKDFYFAYPRYLYDFVEKEESRYKNEYGENVQEIRFAGSKGSELVFSLTERSDDNSLEGMTDWVHASEQHKLYDTSDIIYAVSDQGHGKVIITGWDDAVHSRPVYDLTKIEEDYIMQMHVFFPNYTGEEDRNEKAYVTENLYRMCGFSDSTNAARSYSDFLEGVN